MLLRDDSIQQPPGDFAEVSYQGNGSIQLGINSGFAQQSTTAVTGELGESVESSEKTDKI